MALSRLAIETIIPTINVVFEPSRSGWIWNMDSVQVFENTYQIVLWGYATQGSNLRLGVRYPLRASEGSAFSFDFPSFTPFTFKIPDQEEFKINQPPIFKFQPQTLYVTNKPTVQIAISTFNNSGDQIGISSSNL